MTDVPSDFLVAQFHIQLNDNLKKSINLYHGIEPRQWPTLMLFIYIYTLTPQISDLAVFDIIPLNTSQWTLHELNCCREEATQEEKEIITTTKPSLWERCVIKIKAEEWDRRTYLSRQTALRGVIAAIISVFCRQVKLESVGEVFQRAVTQLQWRRAE